MKNILVVSSEKDALKELVAVFSDHGAYEVTVVASGNDAVEKVKKQYYELVVSDETLSDTTGIKLAEDIVRVNAMINCSLVSTLSDEDFHEASEGLGVLMKLPKPVTREAAEALEAYLNKILNPGAV
jgi:CheY-like chemotaxis protein